MKNHGVAGFSPRALEPLMASTRRIRLGPDCAVLEMSGSARAIRLSPGAAPGSVAVDIVPAHGPTLASTGAGGPRDGGAAAAGPSDAEGLADKNSVAIEAVFGIYQLLSGWVPELGI